MIKIDGAPIQQPPFLDEKKSIWHTAWVMYFNQLTRVAKGEDAKNGESVLSADFTLNQANGTYQDSGVSIALPEAGRYKIYGNVRGFINFSAGIDGYIVAKLYNSTDGADVANSERMIVYGDSVNINYIATAPLDITIFVAEAKTIKLYVARFVGTWTNSAILSGAIGRTNLGYNKVGRA